MAPFFVYTPAEFDRLIKLGQTPEGLYVDFKKTIDGWNLPKGTPDQVRKDAQKELCRDVSQFANTDGGCLVIGVDEVQRADGVRVAKRVEPVVDPDRLRAWIEDAITNRCVPSTFSKDISIIQSAYGTVLVVNIRPHRHAVYVWDTDAKTIELVARTSHGKKRLNPNELERHIMNGSRSIAISFRDALDELASAGLLATAVDVEIVGGISRISETLKGSWMQPTSGRPSIGAHDQNGFVLRVPIGNKNHELRVPFELLSSVWIDDKVLHVLCSAPIVFDANKTTGGQLRFDPFNRLHY